MRVPPAQLLAAPLLTVLLLVLLLGAAAPVMASSSPAPELLPPEDVAPTAPAEPTTSTGTPDPRPPEVDEPDEPAPTDAGPTVAPTGTPGGDAEPTEDAEPTAEATTREPVRLSPTSPALASSSIPLGSVALAVVVLMVGGLLVRTVVRRAEGGLDGDDVGPDGRTTAPPDDTATAPRLTTGTAATTPLSTPPARPLHQVDPDGPIDPATLDFLLALGEALVDAGDPINHVQETLAEVAAVNGVHGVGIVVMPTALFISLPHQDGVQTEVSAAGTSPLRLDQVDELFRLVDQARRGELSPSDGRVALAQIRATGPRFSPAQQLLGHVLFTLGLVMILQGGWLELLVGAGLGLLVGALHLASERFPSSYQPFLPVVAALGASAVVLSVARELPELAVFPPLVAALVAFLPGALLTTAVLELSTGQIMSGSARLAAGMLRLVLLALGILAGAQLVGVPGASIDNPAGGAATVVATWTGVAVFGVGVLLFKGGRWSSLPWILLVLYVAYAGQVLGGLLFGSSLSAFFGALVMTPVAMIAARQESGPPALVSFLPGFWLLVPGAVGLEGVTRFLDEDTAAGISSLVTMGTSMVGIALGVLLGLAVGSQVADRLRSRQEALSRAPA